MREGSNGGGGVRENLFGESSAEGRLWRWLFFCASVQPGWRGVKWNRGYALKAEESEAVCARARWRNATGIGEEWRCGRVRATGAAVRSDERGDEREDRKTRFASD